MRRIGLRQMQAGQKGSIISVDADGELGRRIRDMGLIPGTVPFRQLRQQYTLRDLHR